MLSWQRIHVQRNLPDLIENTTCNTTLVSNLHEIFSMSEMKVLRNENKNHTQRCMKLYTLAMSRVNGFPILIRALDKSRQSGASAILNKATADGLDYNEYELLRCTDNYMYQVSGNFEVHQGSFGTRPAQIKLFSRFNPTSRPVEEAIKELEMLSCFDWHENILRCFTGKHIIRETHIYFAIALENIVRLVEYVKAKDLTGVSYQPLLNGVQFLHDKNIVHLNLKPESIFVDDRHVNHPTNMKIGEFGFAQKVSKTKTCVCPGKLYEKRVACFYTPEVLSNLAEVQYEVEMHDKTADVTFQTDVFCVGVICYFFLSNGGHPFGELLDRTTYIRTNKICVDGAVIGSFSSEWRSNFLRVFSPTPPERPEVNTLSTNI